MLVRQHFKIRNVRNDEEVKLQVKPLTKLQFAVLVCLEEVLTNNNMKEEVYQNAILKSRCIDACKNTSYLFISGGPKEGALKSIDLL